MLKGATTRGGRRLPFSVYSMAMNSADEAPRGMEFLYGLIRVKVATRCAQLSAWWSRARSPSATAAAPPPDRLANALARLVEGVGKGVSRIGCLLRDLSSSLHTGAAGPR